MTVGLIVVNFNDLGLSQKMYPTLVNSITSPYGLVCIDVGSEDGSREFWESKCMTLGPHNPEILAQFGYQPDDLQHLSRCINLGIDVFKRDMSVDKIGWAHVDCDYYNNGQGVGWLEYLSKYLDEHQNIGKICPPSIPHPGRLYTRPGNQCPWILSMNAINALIDKYKEVFDSRYIYMHHEDNCVNNRLKTLGYETIIIGEPDAPAINHKGEASRKNSKNSDQIRQAFSHNAQLYYEEFGTYNQLI